MEKKLKITTPRYQQIAADIAAKIVDKKYNIGEKVYARSSLATQYNVSAETTRRAICILSDLDIVDTTKGSGVIIKSYENAVKFVKQYTDIETINDLKKKILNSLEQQVIENNHLKENISKLMDKTDRFKTINPFIPFEIEITNKTPYLNKNSADINFWHNTSATIIAIKRNDQLLMSPGPHALFLESDIFYFVGDENCYERAIQYLYPNKDNL